MSQLEEISELQELKEQFNLISEKLEQQVIINKTLIYESMTKKSLMWTEHLKSIPY